MFLNFLLHVQSRALHSVHDMLDKMIDNIGIYGPWPLNFKDVKTTT